MTFGPLAKTYVTCKKPTYFYCLGTKVAEVHNVTIDNPIHNVTIINPSYTGGLSHCYMLDKFIYHFRDVGSILLLLFSF